MPVTFGDKKNTYLEIESYKQTAKYLLDFVRRVENFGARVGLDNTVPICMFTSEELAELMLKQVIEPSRNFVCYPALDIGPDLSLWRCFGTSKIFNKKLDDFESVEEAYAYYIRQSRLYQFKFMPFNECETCEHALKERCQGGCIGFADIKSKEMGLAVEDLTDEQILKMKLSLSKNTRIKEYDLPKRTFIISSPQNNTEMEIQPALAELLRLLNGVNTVNDVVQLQVKNSTGSQERDELDYFLQEIANKKMLPLIRGLLDKKLLLEENNDNSSILG